MIIEVCIFLFFSLLLGTIPTGFLIGRFCGVDLRAKGSGNTGATNALRVLGRCAGLITLLIDALKGAIPVIVVSKILSDEIPVEPLIFGVCAVIGHCFNPWLGWRGGRGVATSLGCVAARFPQEALILCAVFLLVVAVSRYVSLGSIIAALLLPVILLIQGYQPLSTAVLEVCAMSLIVISRHVENIRRLIAGTENRFAAK